MVVRGWPLFLPVVVSSITGIPEKCQPSRPPEAPSSTRCTRFMALRARFEGMAGSVVTFVALTERWPGLGHQMARQYETPTPNGAAKVTIPAVRDILTSRSER